MGVRISLLLACSAISLMLGAMTAQGCGTAPTYLPCDDEGRKGIPCPDGLICLEDEQRCVEPDAGSDGGPEAAAISDPCSVGPCVARPPLEWTGPLWLWVGQDDVPSKCPEQAAGMAFEGVADLVVPPANCDPCDCEDAVGHCGALPETIEIRASACGQAGASVPFAGPPGWDGSCTDANALPADAKCPAGSSSLCAQFVSVSPLGAPVDESCTPFTVPAPVPNVALANTRWATQALACHAPTCDDSGKACVPTTAATPEGYRQCVSRQGVHECPGGFDTARYVLHERTVPLSESRFCSECTCGAPLGGLCVAQFKLFKDGACSELISENPFSSGKGTCPEIIPAGLPIGGKMITAPQYFPGVCEPSGGDPGGTVEPEPGHEMTFCCGPDAQ
ncbi:hypothetical protein [Polyangium aurulentum]|uniref:hypothetical protein n=1 Tax=Polyangium aurulentum TaxID=2567896 RepID=UPI0010AEC205|nr:hypothetical protein [Polyangium aurulentum]UQA57065.1 hypothetical protein E8A73_038110 [Polyangium aurulentum]